MGAVAKICGLTRPEDMAACAEAGVRYVGLNFFPKSPRSVSIPQAQDLAVEAPMGMAKVALVVNMDDAALGEIVDGVPLDMLQLHGSETVERVAEVKARFGLPVMKVLGVATAQDVDRIAEYEGVADQILVDAKAPKGADLPGGNGVPFDWRLISTRRWAGPWMLAGGLTPANVAQAVALTGTAQVDVASGVESAPGIKDPALISAFVTAAATGR